MTGDAVQQLLAEIQQRADAATDGPWSAADEHGLLEGAEPAWCVSRMRPGYEAMSETEGYLYDIAYTTGKAEEPDAEFIAAARSDVPRLVAALTAVLDLCASREDFTAGEASLRGFVDPDAYAAECSIVTTKRVRSAVAAALEEQP